MSIANKIYEPGKQAYCYLTLAQDAFDYALNYLFGIVSNEK